MHFWGGPRSRHRFAAVRGSTGILPVGKPGILPGVSALRQPYFKELPGKMPGVPTGGTPVLPLAHPCDAGQSA